MNTGGLGESGGSGVKKATPLPMLALPKRSVSVPVGLTDEEDEDSWLTTSGDLEVSGDVFLSARGRGDKVANPSNYDEATLQKVCEGRVLKQGAENQVLLFETNEKGEPLIVGATPRALLEHVFLQTDPNDRSCGYSWQESIDIIVLMHSYLIKDSQILLKKLLNFLKNSEAKLARRGISSPAELQHGKRVIQVRIINFVRQWLKTDSDWAHDELLRTALLLELQKLLAFPEGETWINTLKTCLPSTASTPTPKLPPSDQTKNFVNDLLAISVQDLAQQLTLLDFELFAAIDMTKELLMKAFMKPETSPNLHNWMNHFNLVTKWIASSILQQQDKKQRAHVLSRFIRTAAYLRSINSFNPLMQVLFAISQTCISRLKETWKALPQKDVTLYEELVTIMSPQNNSSSFRKAFLNATLPTIPFAALVVKDLTFFEETPDRITDAPKLLNVTKIMQIGHMILVLSQAKAVPYDFPRNAGIQESLKMALNEKTLPSEDLLYKMSMVYEPPASKASGIVASTSSPASLTTSPSAGSFLSFFGKEKEKEKEEKKEGKEKDKDKKKKSRSAKDLKSSDPTPVRKQKSHSLSYKNTKEMDTLQTQLKGLPTLKGKGLKGSDEQRSTSDSNGLASLELLKKRLELVAEIVAKETNPTTPDAHQKIEALITDCISSIELLSKNPTLSSRASSASTEQQGAPQPSGLSHSADSATSSQGGGGLVRRATDSGTTQSARTLPSGPPPAPPTQPQHPQSFQQQLELRLQQQLQNSIGPKARPKSLGLPASPMVLTNSRHE